MTSFLLYRGAFFFSFSLVVPPGRAHLARLSARPEPLGFQLRNSSAAHRHRLPAGPAATCGGYRHQGRGHPNDRRPPVFPPPVSEIFSCLPPGTRKSARRLPTRTCARRPKAKHRQHHHSGVRHNGFPTRKRRPPTTSAFDRVTTLRSATAFVSHIDSAPFRTRRTDQTSEIRPATTRSVCRPAVFRLPPRGSDASQNHIKNWLI